MKSFALGKLDGSSSSMSELCQNRSSLYFIEFDLDQVYFLGGTAFH